MVAVVGIVVVSAFRTGWCRTYRMVELHAPEVVVAVAVSFRMEHDCYEMSMAYLDQYNYSVGWGWTTYAAGVR